MVYKARQNKTLWALFCATTCLTSWAVSPSVAQNFEYSELPAAFRSSSQSQKVMLKPMHEIRQEKAEKDLISKGRIFMRRQKAYIPPPAPETIEAKINRIVMTRLEDSEERLKKYTDSKSDRVMADVATRISAASEEIDSVYMFAEKQGQKSAADMAKLREQTTVDMKQIAANAVTESEDFIRSLARDTLLTQDEQIRSVISQVAKDTVINADANLASAIRGVAREVVLDGDSEVMKVIRQQAKNTMLGSDEQIEDAIRRVAKRTVTESDQQIDDAIRKIARRTVLEADPQVLNAIRKVVNLAVLESDQPVEYTVRRIIEERFGEIENDPIALAVQKVTADTIRNEADRIAQDTKAYTRLALEKNQAEDQLALKQTHHAIIDAVERSKDVEQRVRSYADRRFMEQEIDLAETRAAVEASEARTKLFAADKASRAEQHVILARKEAELAEERTQRQIERHLSRNQIEAVTLQQEIAAAEERLKMLTERLALEQQQKSQAAFQRAELGEERAKLFAQKESLRLQEQTARATHDLGEKFAQINLETKGQAQNALHQAQMAEERSKRYTAEKMLESQQRLASAETAAQLAEERAKAFAQEKLAEMATKVAVAEEANKLVQEKALTATKEAERRLVAQLNSETSQLGEQVAANQNALSQTKEEILSQVADVQDGLSHRIALNQEAMQQASEKNRTYVDQRLAAATTYLEQLTQAESALVTARLQEYASRQVQKLAEVQDYTTTATRQLAELKATEIEERLKAYTEDKVAKVMADSSEAMKSLAGETLASAQQDLQNMAFKARLTESEIQAIAESTLKNATPAIQALALQTLADSDNYIKTVARQAVQEGDPAMQEALAAAARQVILDENNNVAFAIRTIVDEAIDEKNLVAKNSELIGHDGIVMDDEILDDGRIAVGELKEPGAEQVVFNKPRHREDWVNIRDYHVVVHENNETLDKIFKNIITRAEPFVGPWEVKWKLKAKNKDILDERFSLDAETTFEEFANYLAQYMFNTRNVPLTFNMFDAERVLVISDE